MVTCFHTFETLDDLYFLFHEVFCHIHAHPRSPAVLHRVYYFVRCFFTSTSFPLTSGVRKLKSRTYCTALRQRYQRRPIFRDLKIKFPPPHPTQKKRTGEPCSDPEFPRNATLRLLFINISLLLPEPPTNQPAVCISAALSERSALLPSGFGDSGQCFRFVQRG